MTDPDPEYQATNVRDVLDLLAEEGIGSEIDDFDENVEQFARRVVEDGTFTPDCSLTAQTDLTILHRLTGTFEWDVSGMLQLGMLLGAALERDVPTDSEREAAWRDGRVDLPDTDRDGDVDPTTECPACGEPTNKFVGECENCGNDRWAGDRPDWGDE